MSASSFCCAECFDDPHLRRQVIPARSRINGACTYCGALNQALIEPIALREYFELVTGLYKENPDGESLPGLLRRDWAMFDRLDNAHVKELLAEILDDGQIVRKKFSADQAVQSGTLGSWAQLRTELMHRNRYFPSSDIDFDWLQALLEHLLIVSNGLSNVWYRARIQSSETCFRADEMGAPPAQLASHGRANPAGIPYLYVASKLETAIAEVRPHGGDLVSVAEISIPAELKLADLRHPRKTISPFELSDEKEIAQLRSDIDFLESLGHELTRPVLPRSAAYDYIPSQYICEFAKKCGFDGVLYQSSVEGGMNLALFDPAICSVQNVFAYTVQRITVQSQAAT